MTCINLRAGYRLHAIDGYILNANQDMLGLAGHLGFVQPVRDGDLATVARALQ